jgi:protein involved in polysaccharide export with SLBB domain
MRMKRILLAAFVLLTSAVSASAQLSAPATKAAGSESLRPGDVLKLWIWREEEMSGSFPVPEDGVVVLPKIGARKVIGRVPAELKAEIVADYQKYLRNPSIEITFLRRVNVLGAVKEPGVYPVDETMTIANVLALAGGTTSQGKQDEVQLHREGKKLVARITQQTRIADLPLQSGDQLYVPERSWAARNSPLVAAFVSGLVSVAIAVIVQN